MLDRLRQRYEAFLRIERNAPVGELVRLRALYGFGWLFVFIQMLNLAGMTFTYRSWTGDHTIAVVVSLVILTAIHGLRYYKNFGVYAAAIFFLCSAGVLASALPDHTGVNSALLPLLVMTPVLTSFIAGPRSGLVTGAASLAIIAVLYWCSATHLDVASPYYGPRNLQRALQATFAVIMVTGVAAVISASIFHTFGLLEANIKRAQKAEAAKSDFLASMSHELRTPLNGVLGLTDALSKTDLDPEQTRLMGAVHSSGRSLMLILNDILDLSKIDAGKLETTPMPFDPRALVREIADTWRESATAKNLAFNTHVDEATPAILLGDDLRIRQIVSNLVSNAVKFTDNGFIDLSLTTTAQDDDTLELEIAVRDTGEGIDRSVQERIFHAFEQAENSIARRRGGTGLGLSICRRLATLMSGSISVQSTPGEGSVFRLALPVKAIIQEPHAPTPTAPAPPPKDVNLNGLRVLLAEDNAINQMVAQKFLDNLDVITTVAANGKECLDALEAEEIDFILMDKHMPVMDGMAATAAIRALPDARAALPIIACTADAMTGERDALIAAGFSDFLANPITLETLEEVLRRAAAARAPEPVVAA